MAERPREEEYTEEETQWLLSIHEWEKQKAKKIPNIILTLEENETLEQIKNIASILFNTKDWLTNACYYTKQMKQCRDWSTLYTIMKINNKDVLIKVWAGEFNTEVFNQENINSPSIDYKYIKWFSRTPIPLFVVNQEDNYFANEEQKLEKLNNPQKYLQDNSVIVVPQKKQAYIKTENNIINFNDIKILPTDDVIKQLQTALLESKFSEKEIEKISDILFERKNKTIEKFKWMLNYKDSNGKGNSELHKKLIPLLEQIIPEHWNPEQMHKLLQSYNKKKNTFE